MADLGRRLWGRRAGRDIWLFSLRHGGGMSAAVSNYGGILQSLIVRDAGGVARDVVLGYDALDEYISDEAFFGASIGPVADRMALGRCALGWCDVELPKNAGPDAMHSGPNGFHSRIWDWEALPDGISLQRAFADGELGFPGALDARIAYRLPAPGVLRIEYWARCDRETAASFTNHSYFNLDGAARDCREHVLRLRASEYAETTRTADPIATGRALDVRGTPLDFRDGRRIGDAVARSEYPEIASAGGVDHYFPVAGAGLRDMASLKSPHSGIRLTCSSDAPGVLVYTGNGLRDVRGKAGAVYGEHWGVCLETECFPNAVNIPARRRDVLLGPGDIYRSATEFSFGA